MLKASVVAWLGLTSVVGAQPGLLWLDQFGTKFYDGGYGLVRSDDGGVFVAGSAARKLGGPYHGKVDAFIARYDVAGHQLWVTQLGTAGDDTAFAAATDASGGLFIAGWTDGDLGGPNAGYDDAFLARCDGQGHFAWVVQLGTSSTDVAVDLAPDGQGGVYIAGYTYGILGEANAGTEDAFVGRYNGQGQRLWLLQLGTSEYDSGKALAPDGQGGVYLGGDTSGSLGGPYAGGYDTFLARFDSTGQQLWITQFGNKDLEYCRKLAPDGQGGVFVSGDTSGGYWDAWLMRRDGSGQQLWTTHVGIKNLPEYTHALTIDGAGGVVIGGATGGELGGPYSGGWDMFLAGYDAGGVQRWITQVGSSETDWPWALAPDASDGFYMTGITEGSWGGPNLGSDDIFLARFGTPCPADCDGSFTADLFDMLCFINLFNAGDAAADCTRDGLLDLGDFNCFVGDFDQGC